MTKHARTHTQIFSLTLPVVLSVWHGRLEEQTAEAWLETILGDVSHRQPEVAELDSTCVADRASKATVDVSGLWVLYRYRWAIPLHQTAPRQWIGKLWIVLSAGIGWVGRIAHALPHPPLP